MFTAEDIKARIREQPFVPLRILTSGGEHYDISHPDLALVLRRSVYVGTASQDNPTIAERASHVAIMHITALENLPAPGKAQHNGQ